MKVVKRGSTKDFSLFHLMPGNRKYNPGHVERLARSIKANNMLDACPIICVEEKHGLLVVDGQHRLAACKQIGCAVNYVIVDAVTPGDMVRMNVNVRSWGTKDYLCHYVALGLQSYITLQKFILQTNVPIAVAADLMSGNVNEGSSTGAGESFRSGNYIVKDEKHAYIVANVLSSLKASGCVFSNARSLVKAIHMIISFVPGFDTKKFIDRVSMIPLQRRAMWQHYVDQIDEIYNYRSPLKCRLHIKTIMTDNGAFALCKVTA